MSETRRQFKPATQPDRLKIVGRSTLIRQVLEMAGYVAATDATVLLMGETGTGKELVAERIHDLSPRHARPMIRVNSAALPPTLIESELFGRERGAYTDASSTTVGRFELADRSTLFLDEIGDLPLDVQVKLLRVLDCKCIERLGNPKPIRVDARLVVATHRDLERMVAKATFREDLYYRLNVFPIRVPPLRERPEDIPVLVWHFVQEFSAAFGKQIDTVPAADMDALREHPWPGNVRELRNVVERAMILAEGRELRIQRPSPPWSPSAGSTRLAVVERNSPPLRRLTHRSPSGPGPSPP
jgi:transcriptional regulator with GAF, ATPase, and Fis domain